MCPTFQFVDVPMKPEYKKTNEVDKLFRKVKRVMFVESLPLPACSCSLCSFLFLYNEIEKGLKGSRP